MIRILDQIGRELSFEKAPGKVVSLVPSITELAHDLGFEVIGKTKFCVHPVNLNTATIIGGTKNVKTDLVEKLNPDLVLANKEENTKETVEILLKLKIPVFVSDVSTIDESLDLIEKLGALGKFEEKANDLVLKTKTGFGKIGVSQPNVNALYLIWKDPFMAAGTDTYISDVMSRLGLINVLSHWGDKGLRYPTLTDQAIEELAPNVILLSSEPYPFREIHRKSIVEKFQSTPYLVDGECFSWYGSRQTKSMDYLAKFSRLLREGDRN